MKNIVDIPNYVSLLYQNGIIVLRDTLKKGSPYIPKAPRNHASIFYVTKGQLYYKKDGVCTVIGNKKIGYIRKGSLDESGAYECDAVSYITISFVIEQKEPFGDEEFFFPTACSDGTYTSYKRLFEELFRTYTLKPEGYMEICGGLLIQLIGYLKAEQSLNSNTQKSILQLRDSIRYLENNYHDPNFEICELSRICGISEKQYRRIFKAAYHCNPYQFLQRFRVDQAASLLDGTSKSVSEIAELCGFSDLYSFSHSFKNMTGTSPNLYRNRKNKA